MVQRGAALGKSRDSAEHTQAHRDHTKQLKIKVQVVSGSAGLGLWSIHERLLHIPFREEGIQLRSDIPPALSH